MYRLNYIRINSKGVDMIKILINDEPVKRDDVVICTQIRFMLERAFRLGDIINYELNYNTDGRFAEFNVIKGSIKLNERQIKIVDIINKYLYDACQMFNWDDFRYSDIHKLYMLIEAMIKIVTNKYISIINYWLISNNKNFYENIKYNPTNDTVKIPHYTLLEINKFIKNHKDLNLTKHRVTDKLTDIQFGLWYLRDLSNYIERSGLNANVCS